MADRRSFIAGLAVAPVVIAAPAVAEPSSFMPIYNHFMAIWAAYNNAPADTPFEEEERLGDIYMEAYEDLIRARPTNDREFRLKFLALWDDGGAPREAVVSRVLEDAHRLAG